MKCTGREKLAPNVHLARLVPDRILVFAVRPEDMHSGPSSVAYLDLLVL